MSYSDWSLSPKKMLQAFPNLPTSFRRYLPYALLFLAFLGFLDATYLTVLHYKNAIPPCTLHGCEVVLTSQFATVAGIPIALIGALYYMVIIILVGVLIELRNTSHESRKEENRNSLFVIRYSKVVTSLVLLTGLGLFVGLGLVFLQAFVLHAFCQYCLASEVIDFLLLDVSWWISR